MSARRWILAAIVALLALGAARGAARMAAIHDADAPRASSIDAMPAARALRGDRPLAVVIAGADGTEITDLVPPHAILAEAELEVIVVAPERRPVPLVSGLLTDAGVDLVPDLSLAEYDAEVGRAPDVLVVPYVPRREGVDRALVPWIASHVGEHTTLLTVCAGSALAAEAGLLVGRRASTHPAWIARMRELHPETQWVEDVRWVQDGSVIASGGLSAGLDAAIAAVSRLAGRDVAIDVARRVGADPRYLDDPRFVARGTHPASIVGLVVGRDDARVGLALHDGIDGVTVAATLDLAAATLLARPVAIGDAHRVIRTRQGLALAPRAISREGIDVLAPRGEGYDAAIAVLSERYGAWPARAAADGLLWPR